MSSAQKQELDDLKLLIDYASSTVIYYGYASPGASQSASVWRIRRETRDSNGRTTAIEYAGGTAERDQVWANRATLEYS
jgi:hypothetical protein